MIRQYKAQRRRGGHNPLGVGVISVGSIYYLQDRGFFHDRFEGRAICRNPWIVEAFLNGTFHAARRNPETGFWEDAVISARSDTAVVRSLRDGRRATVAVRLLQLHDDIGLTKQPTSYPSFLELRLLHRKLRRDLTKVTRTGIIAENRGADASLAPSFSTEIAKVPKIAEWLPRAGPDLAYIYEGENDR